MNVGCTVAACFIDGVDIADVVGTQTGSHLDWPLYSNGKYDKSQSEADHAGRWNMGQAITLLRGCFALHWQGGKPGDCSDDANMHP